ncbi:MAG: hypothetical protein Q9164_002485 [Protoblastenia rupestris]
MELYTTGFNAHNQLLPTSLSDSSIITTFHPLASPFATRNIKIWCTLWSATVISHDDQLTHYGFRKTGTTPSIITGLEVQELKSVFGDVSGVLGAVGRDGALYVFSEEGKGCVFRPWEGKEGSLFWRDGVRVEFVAVAESEEVCLTTCSGEGNGEWVLHLFSNWKGVLDGLEPVASWPLDGVLVDLKANALLIDHTLLTFGSPLHPALLGRTPTTATLATEPHPVSFLGGLPIRKIAANGWLGAALSMDRDVYIWGGRAGDHDRLSALPDPGASEGEEVKLVDIDGGVDIADIAIGMGHLVALTTDGEVWVCGDGERGQLGLGEGAKGFEANWVMTPSPWTERGRLINVEAGGWGSWLFVDPC